MASRSRENDPIWVGQLFEKKQPSLKVETNTRLTKGFHLTLSLALTLIKKTPS